MSTNSFFPPLNDIQLSLLKLFSHPMSENETRSVQKLLIEYYTKILHEEVEKVIDEKGYTDEDFDQILNKQHRGK